jgi:5-methyltetrahydrofolate--homocysteine methyltransferase
VDGGARIIGGCCGTSFAHLKAMREALDGHQKTTRPTVADVVSRIGPMRNKPANQSGATSEGGRRERRRVRG